MKQALRSGDRARLGAIRMALAAIQQREVDERAQLDEAAVVAVIEKLIKQRRESIEMYRSGNRHDLADKEAAEIDVLQAYLPEPLGAREITALIDEAFVVTGAASLKDMSKIMSFIKSRAAGRADMAAVSAQVRARLTG
jgi:uncharacterized protein YqeY